MKVNDEMVQAAVEAYFNAEVDHQNPAMRAAIEAAFQVVGRIDENNRLRSTGAYAVTRKYAVTDAMILAAYSAYRCAGQCDPAMENAIHAALEMSDLAEQIESLQQASITAAIEASGLVEENERLRSNIEGLAKIIRDSIKENDGPDRVWIDGIAYEGPLADNYFKAMRLILTTFDLILKKEHP
jgi:hypothetical protein